MKLAAGSGAKPTASSNQFIVKVADNFHPYDEDDVYTKGSYATYAEAERVATQIVSDSLVHIIKHMKAKPGMTKADVGREAFQCYTSFGDDAFIVTPPGHPRFSARAYAKELCDWLVARTEKPASV